MVWMNYQLITHVNKSHIRDQMLIKWSCLSTLCQAGIFDDEDDDNDDGNVAAVLMKAGILSMLEGVLKKRQRLGKKAAALLKTQVGRLANMILHPNVQLRDREAIHYVDLHSARRVVEYWI